MLPVVLLLMDKSVLEMTVLVAGVSHHWVLCSSTPSLTPGSLSVLEENNFCCGFPLSLSSLGGLLGVQQMHVKEKGLLSIC